MKPLDVIISVTHINQIVTITIYFYDSSLFSVIPLSDFIMIPFYFSKKLIETSGTVIIKIELKIVNYCDRRFLLN